MSLGFGFAGPRTGSAVADAADRGFDGGLANLSAMMQTLASAHIDLVVLDIMLLGKEGLSLCRESRAGGRLPIIMLTAIGSETDRVVGLEMGADDNLAKPFDPRELLARIRAIPTSASPVHCAIAIPRAAGPKNL